MSDLLKLLQITPLDVIMFIVNVGVFFVFYSVINSLFFRNYLLLLNDRDKSTVGKNLLTADILSEASVKLDLINEKLKSARQEISEERGGIVLDAKNKAKDLIERTNVSNGTIVKSTQEQIRQQKIDTQIKLASSVEPLAKLLLERIQGKKVQAIKVSSGGESANFSDSQV
jgi:F0F1-type ATP synthase membrane subunit b/b'